MAYGSNLNIGDWRDFCRCRKGDPSLIHPRSTAYLPDWELVFDYHSKTRNGGALDLRPRTGQLVAGILFDVEAEGWELLDRKEGAPDYYERMGSYALLPDGGDLPVITYRVQPTRREGFIQPTEEYVEIVRSGLRSYSLDDRMLSAVSRNQSPEWTVPFLFVYGTLLQGECRSALLNPFGIIGLQPAKAPGKLLDLGSYPGMVATEKREEWVHGELLEIKDLDRALTQLDTIEGFQGFGQPGSLFRRALTEVEKEDQTKELAWTYYYHRDPHSGKQIHSGSWRRRSTSASLQFDPENS